jgi:hypothetical protein
VNHQYDGLDYIRAVVVTLLDSEVKDILRYLLDEIADLKTQIRKLEDR